MTTTVDQAKPLDDHSDCKALPVHDRCEHCWLRSHASVLATLIAEAGYRGVEVTTPGQLLAFGRVADEFMAALGLRPVETA